MTDRRLFLQAGLALPVASALSSSLAWTPANANERATLQLEQFVYDVRFAESYDVAQELAGRGIETAAIADDLMTLWYDDLDLRWKRAPMTLGGLTLTEALFVLETFALDRGMRVVFRGEHSAVSEGRIVHKLTGPAAMLESFAHGADNWEDNLARVMTQCPAEITELSETRFETPAVEPALRDVPLLSWIIAPRSAVNVSP